jgi:hypothetical protein
MFVQRAGQAARNKLHTGLAVLLAELTAYSTDIEATLRHKAGTAASRKAKKGSRTKKLPFHGMKPLVVD